MNPDELALHRLFDAARAEPVPSGARERALAHLASSASIGSGAAVAAGKFGFSSYVAAAAAAAFVALGIAVFVPAVRHPKLTEQARRDGESPGVAMHDPIPMPPPMAMPGPPMRPGMRMDVAINGGDRVPVSRAAAHAACTNVSLADAPPTTCSTNGEPLLMEIVNTCGEESMDIYWVNYQCKEVFYRQLAPGETLMQSTFATHPWRVRDHASHRLVKEIGTTPPTNRAAVVPPAKRPIEEISIRPNDEATEQAAADAGRCSEAGFPAELAVTNERSEAIEFYWLDYDCREIFKGRAEPGARWLQRTQDSHRFRVRSESTHRLLREFVINAHSEAARAYVAVP